MTTYEFVKALQQILNHPDLPDSFKLDKIEELVDGFDNGMADLADPGSHPDLSQAEPPF